VQLPVHDWLQLHQQSSHTAAAAAAGLTQLLLPSQLGQRLIW
jgi:hypothetical protein